MTKRPSDERRIQPPVPEIARQMATAVGEFAESVLDGSRMPVNRVKAWTELPDSNTLRLAAAREYAGAAEDSTRPDVDVGVLCCAIVGLAYVDACLDERPNHDLVEVMGNALRGLQSRKCCPADLQAMADRVSLRGPGMGQVDLTELRSVAAFLRGQGPQHALDRDLALVPTYGRDEIRAALHRAATVQQGNTRALIDAIGPFVNVFDPYHAQAESGLFHGTASLDDPRDGVCQALAEAILAGTHRLARSWDELGATVNRLMAEWKEFGRVPKAKVYESAARLLGLSRARRSAPKRSSVRTGKTQTERLADYCAARAQKFSLKELREALDIVGIAEVVARAVDQFPEKVMRYPYPGGGVKVGRPGL